MTATDILQTRISCSLVILFETVFGLRSRLEKMFCVFLAKAYCVGLSKRFGVLLVDDEHKIGSMLISQFKLNYIPEDSRLTLKRKLVIYVKKIKSEINWAVLAENL